MGKRLRVQLLPNWAAGAADDSGGLRYFYRADSRDSGALQFSILAEYRSGKAPNPTTQDLIQLAQQHGERNEAGELVETASGNCRLGTFGTAVFRSAEDRMQLWYLSNGFDFVLATHVCCTEPEAVELAEAQQIVGLVELSE